jgi:hypothetical protein
MTNAPKVEKQAHCFCLLYSCFFSNLLFFFHFGFGWKKSIPNLVCLENCDPLWQGIAWGYTKRKLFQIINKAHIKRGGVRKKK